MKGLTPGIHELEFLLDNKFFADIEGTEVQKGNVKAFVSVKQNAKVFELDFDLKGVAVVPCDRCLDDMDVLIDAQNHLVVKFGKEYAEEGDDVIIVPEEEGAINIAWFLYEFVVLAIPIRHVHAPGKCDKEMASKLRQHISRHLPDGEDDGMEENGDDIFPEKEDVFPDPRWDALKGLIGNDNN